MRMNSRGDGDNTAKELRRSITAEILVNNFSERQIGDIIVKYGEDRNWRKIAKAIVAARAIAPIQTTRQLANIIAAGLGREDFPLIPKHPAVKTFQSIRIYINDELNELRRGLQSAELLLRPSGRCIVVTFHSLEDRIAKDFFRQTSGYYASRAPSPYSDRFTSPAAFEAEMELGTGGGRSEEKIELHNKWKRKQDKWERIGANSKFVAPEEVSEVEEDEDEVDEMEDGEEKPYLASFMSLVKHTVKPTRDEVNENPRSRSAKLRAAERTHHPPLFSTLDA
ncbi:hypothetical protein HK104_004809 [Borealophlyctis nickersoniae]|nr:hypothetical protein HK104_004809 [Borealophlyctis nickersoniae]